MYCFFPIPQNRLVCRLIGYCRLSLMLVGSETIRDFGGCVKDNRGISGGIKLMGLLWENGLLCHIPKQSPSWLVKSKSFVRPAANHYGVWYCCLHSSWIFHTWSWFNTWGTSCPLPLSMDPHKKSGSSCGITERSKLRRTLVNLVRWQQWGDLSVVNAVIWRRA